MLRLGFVLISISFYASVFSQNIIKKYDYSQTISDDYVYTMERSVDGSRLLLAGKSTVSALSKPLILLLDSLGTVKNALTLANNGTIYSSFASQDTGFFIAGVLSDGGANKAFVAKIDLYGALKWIKTFNTTGNSYEAKKIIRTLDNQIIAACNANESFDWNPFFAKLDNNGNLLSLRYDRSVLSNNNTINTVVQLPDSNYLGFGSIQVGLNTHIYVNQTNKLLSSLGSPKGLARNSGNGGTALDAIYLSDGDVLLVGSVFIDATQNTDMLVMKIKPQLTSTSDIKWVKTMGSPQNDILTSVQQKNNGNLVLTGYTDALSNYDGCIIEIDTLGNLINSQLVGFSQDEWLHAVSNIDNNRYAFAGYQNNSNHDLIFLQIQPGDTNCFVKNHSFVFTDRTNEYTITSWTSNSNSNAFQNNPSVTSTSVTINNTDLCSTTFITASNNTDSSIRLYPQPAADKVFMYSTKPLYNANLAILNLNGQVLIKHSTLQGNSCSINVENLPNGIYLLKIEDANSCEHLKLFITK